jgi:hypothetical protein
MISEGLFRRWTYQTVGVESLFKVLEERRKNKIRFRFRFKIEAK